MPGSVSSILHFIHSSSNVDNQSPSMEQCFPTIGILDSNWISKSECLWNANKRLGSIAMKKNKTIKRRCDSGWRLEIFPLYRLERAQEPIAQDVVGHPRVRLDTLGAAGLPHRGLGPRLLLHLEGSQVHRQGRLRHRHAALRPHHRLPRFDRHSLPSKTQ